MPFRFVPGTLSRCAPGVVEARRRVMACWYWFPQEAGGRPRLRAQEEVKRSDNLFMCSVTGESARVLVVVLAFGSFCLTV